MNKIVETYSRLADEYRRDEESQSCWYLAAEKALAAIELKERYRTVADLGCGHGAIVHGARIGENALIGMNAVVMDNAVVGAGSIVGALCFVPSGMKGNWA